MADLPRARCLCLDIETARQDRTVLRELGAYRPDLDARLKLKGSAPDFATRLDAITAGAAFVLGHNVVAFDQPALATLPPGLALHRLPLIDTLELSPVAFPQNPYHRSSCGHVTREGGSLPMPPGWQLGGCHPSSSPRRTGLSGYALLRCSHATRRRPLRARSR